MQSDGTQLTALWFTGTRDESRKRRDAVISQLPVFEETCHWLDCYFAGKRPDFTPPYRIEGATAFRQAVLREVEVIPYGCWITYGDIAKKIASRRGIFKMSAQAVGSAVGWNPICLIIPCHRVLGANRALTGYAGGIENKIALLRLEGQL